MAQTLRPCTVTAARHTLSPGTRFSSEIILSQSEYPMSSPGIRSMSRMSAGAGSGSSGMRQEYSSPAHRSTMPP